MIFVKIGFILLLTALFILTDMDLFHEKTLTFVTPESFGNTIWSWDATKFSQKEIGIIFYLNPTYRYSSDIVSYENVTGPIYKTYREIYEPETCECDIESAKSSISDVKTRISEYEKIKTPELHQLIRARNSSLRFKIRVAEAKIRFCETYNTKALILNEYGAKDDTEFIEILKTIDLEPNNSKKLCIVNSEWDRRIFELYYMNAFDEEEKYWKIFESKYIKKYKIYKNNDRH